jgi:Bacterial archaeo-eukaryotic release factor family 7
MDFLSRDDFKTLMQRRQGWCLSLYMPAHRIVPEAVQDPIRFKNLLRQAGERLQAVGLRAPEAEQMLRPAETLLDNKRFWQQQSDGLVTFVASDLLRYYRLPLLFEELVVVNDRFYLKPLLPLLSGDDRFYVLALSQKEVRLLKCTRYLVSEVELEGVPKNMAEALKYDDPERQLQFHTGTAPGTGRRPAMFHGQGVGIDDTKDKILRYFHQVDRGLHALLREEHAPLMLAAVDYLLPIYREANTYAHLLSEKVSGNPEGRRPDELHAQAWKLIEPYFRQAQEEALSQYHRLVGTGRTSTEIRDILPAAAQGRVACLCVAVGLQQWGTYAADTGTIEMHSEAQPGDEDLLDLAAVLTISNSGTVYAVEPAGVPSEAPLAAIYRY